MLVQVFIGLFCVAIFTPLFLWFVRNVSRVVFKHEITILAEWLKWIFIVSWTLALIFMLIWILIAANIIAR